MAFELELMDMRRCTKENYELKYRDLKKLFLEKSWIEKIAADYRKNVIFTMANNNARESALFGKLSSLSV